MRDAGHGLSDEGRRLRDIARLVIEKPSRIMRLPLMDHLSVALILDRREFLPDGDFTMLQAVNHLGPGRIKIAVAVERALMLDAQE